MKQFESQELTLPIRALIVGYRLQFQCTFVEISMKLGINNNTAQKFYARVLKDAGGVEDLYEMLQHLESKPRPGAPPIIEPGEQSTHVRELVRKHATFSVQKLQITTALRPPSKNLLYDESSTSLNTATPIL